MKTRLHTLVMLFAMLIVGHSPSAATIKISLTPTTASVPAGTGTQTFIATVTGSTNTAVTWQVNNTTGGTTATGKISTSGVYTAPATVPSPAT